MNNNYSNTNNLGNISEVSIPEIYDQHHALLRGMIDDDLINDYNFKIMMEKEDQGKGDYPNHFIKEPQDFSSEALADLENLKTLAHESDKKKRFIRMRSETGMSKETIGKIRLEDVPIRMSAINHYCTITTLAPILTARFNSFLLDVDSKYNMALPWSSDITLASTLYDNFYILIDVTKSSSLEEPLATLEESAIRSFNKLGLVVLCLVLRVDTGRYSIFEEDLDLELPPLENVPNMTYNFSRALNDSILKSSREEISALEKVLEKKVNSSLDPLLDSYIQRELKESTLADELKVIMEAIDTTPTKNLCKERILKAVESHDSDMVDIYAELYKISLERTLPKASRFFSLLGEGITLNHWERVLRFPLAAHVNDKDVRMEVMVEAYNHDLMFWTVHKILSLKDLEAASRGLVLKESLTFATIPYNALVSFDRPQNTSTIFGKGHVAYVRRLKRYVQVFINKKTGEEVRGHEAFAAYRKEKAKEKFSEEDVSFFEQIVYSPGVQILMNPLYYKDESFHKFIDRHNRAVDLSNDASNKELRASNESSGPKEIKKMEENLSRFNEIKKSLKDVEAMVEASILKEEEIEDSLTSISSLESKAAILLRAKSQAHIADQFQQSRTFTGNRIQSYFDQEYELHRAINTVLVAGSPANYVTISNVAGHASSVLVYVNAPAVSFHTTWIKVLSVGPRNMCKWTENGVVSESIENLPIKGLNLAFFDYALAVEARGMRNLIREASLGDSLVVSSSKFYSIDSRHHDWALLRSHKTSARMMALIESRANLYLAESLWRGWDNTLDSSGTPFARRELAYNLTGYLSNRQQNTISQMAYRYLHQSAVGVDSDLFGIIEKLKGIRLKWNVEISSYAKQICVFSLSVLLKSKYGVNMIRAGNKEAFLVAPDLLKASRDPHLNVSTYASSSQFNPDKFNRTPSEAECMELAWEQKRLYEKTLKDHPEAADGFSTSDCIILEEVVLFLNSSSVFHEKESLSSLGFEHLSLTVESRDYHHDFSLESSLYGVIIQRNLVRILTELIKEDILEIGSSIENILRLKRGTQYTKSFWVVLLAALTLRREIGTYDSVSKLSTTPLTSFFTTAGSLFSPPVRGVENVTSIRKITASTLMLHDRLTFGERKLYSVNSDAADVFRSSTRTFVDLFDVVFCLIWSILTPVWLIQFSEKDAEGKDREISTLHIYFALLCSACEDSSRGLSSRIPEDLITERNKEAVFSKMITKSVSTKGKDPNKATVFMSCDMKKYGPNIMNEVNILSASILSPDQQTYFLYETTIIGSSKKIVRPPHNLLRQSLRPYGTINRDTGEIVYEAALGENDKPCAPNGKTAKTLLKLHQQYHQGNENGPKGSVCVNIPQGMPGQGIFTITCSINHSAAVRFLIRYLKRVFNWDVWSVVTSDDSLTTVTFPSEDMGFVSKSLRVIRAVILSLFGLLDNESKLNIVYLRPEMNSFYHLSTEAVMPVWRFVGSYIFLHTSPNLQEDLLSCIASAADTCKVGGSQYVASVVAVMNMCLVLDAHHCWPLYYSSLLKWTVDGNKKDNLLFQIPECFGIPSIDVASVVLSPMGLRASSMASVEDDDSFLQLYSKWLSQKLLEIPTVSSGAAASDTRGKGEVLEFDLYKLKDGEGSGTITALPQVMMPHVTGLTGSLRRRKGTLRISRELGESLISMRSLAVPTRGSFSGLSIITTVLNGLTQPLTKGEYDLSPRIQFSDLQHSFEFPCLKVAPECLLKELSGNVSRKDVFEALIKPGRVEKLYDDFKILLSDPKEIPNYARDICGEIESEIMLVAGLSRDTSLSRLVREEGALGGFEENKMVLGPRKIQKRVVSIGKPRSFLVDWDKIEVGILSSLLRREEYSKMPMEFKILMPPEMAKGELDAVRSSNLLTAVFLRLKNSLGGRYQMLTHVRNTSRTYDQFMDDFLTLNVTLGHRALRPGAPYLERSLVLKGRGGNSAIEAVRPVVITVIEERIKSIVSVAARGAKDIFENPLKSISFSPRNMADLSLQGFRGELNTTSYFLKDGFFSLALGCSNTSLKCSFERFESCLLLSSIHGWVGTESEKFKVEGKVAYISSEEGSEMPIYSLIKRHFDEVEGRMVYTHLYLGPQFRREGICNIRYLENSSKETKALIALGLERYGKTIKKVPRKGAIDVIRFSNFHADQELSFTTIGLFSCILYEDGPLSFKIPISKIPEVEIISSLQEVKLVSLEPVEPLASSFFNDLGQFKEFLSSLNDGIDHNELFSQLDGSISSLISSLSLAEEEALKTWSISVVGSLGAKVGKRLLDIPGIKAASPIWIFDKEDSWEDVNGPLDQGHLILKEQEILYEYTRLEWLEDLTLQFNLNSARAYSSKTLQVISSLVYESGYSPSSILLYLASCIYLLLYNSRELKSSTTSSKISGILGKLPSGKKRTLKDLGYKVPSLDEAPYSEELRQKEDTPSIYSSFKHKLLPALSLKEMVELSEIQLEIQDNPKDPELVGPAERLREALEAPPRDPEEVMREIRAHAAELSKVDAFDDLEPEPDLDALIRSLTNGS